MPRRLSWVCAAGLVFLTLVAFYTARDPGSWSAQTLGDFSILLAVLVAAGSCALAARKAFGSGEGPAWMMLAVAATVWALSMMIYTGIRHHPGPRLPLPVTR